MKIKSCFLIIVALLLCLSLLLIYYFTQMNNVYFFVGEAIIVVLFIFLYLFYRKMIKPIHSIALGMELLQEQDFSSRLSRVGQYDADKIVVIFNRLMEQIKNERLRLREQNVFLDLLIEASPMAVLVLSFKGEIEQVNPMAAKFLELSQDQLIGSSLSSLPHPLAKELLNIERNKSSIVRIVDSNIYKCIHSTFLDRGFHHSFYLIEKITEEVTVAERRAYEKVIRMIAHEVNNSVAGMTSMLDTVQEALREDSEMTDIREAMNLCSERCFSLSKFITGFANVVKIPSPHFQPTNINNLVVNCLHFMSATCRDKQISIKQELDADFPLIMVDSVLFEQVVVNIIKNSIESIEELGSSNGQIIVRTLSPNRLEIIDNGRGIEKEVESKLFSPFYSTKPNGQGLGLIFIREVLNSHCCNFSLITREEGATCFSINFKN